MFFYTLTSTASSVRAALSLRPGGKSRADFHYELWHQRKTNHSEEDTIVNTDSLCCFIMLVRYNCHASLRKPQIFIEQLLLCI